MNNFSFFHYFWCQNWDQCTKWVEKTPIYNFSTFGSKINILGIQYAGYSIFFTWKIKIINFKNSDFCKLLRLPLVQFSKLKNFLWVCWFLGKNLSNFRTPFWKLHNPYCYSLQLPIYFLATGRPLILINVLIIGVNDNNKMKPNGAT